MQSYIFPNKRNFYIAPECFMFFNNSCPVRKVRCGTCQIQFLHITFPMPSSSSISGTSYKLWASIFSIIHSEGTLQNKDSFSRKSLGKCLEVLQTIISGCIPRLSSSLTLCWVGFDFCSPFFKIRYKRYMNKTQFSRPTLIAT